MAENKTSTNKRPNWGKLGGGTGKMHKFSGTGTQEPGQSAQEGHGSRRGIEPKAGPSDVMGFSSSTQNSRGAGPQAPGQSHQEGGRQDGFAKGGNTSMFGNRGSRPAVGGKTAPE